MLKIGDFSRLSRVSIRMLRYYDEAGLLKPVKVDRFTGYRYYEERQLLAAGQISALRDMGFGVAAIGELLHGELDAAARTQIFAVQRAQLGEEAEKLSRQIKLLDNAIAALRKDENMKYDCVIKTLPERYVASVREIIPRYEDEGRLWHYLMSETAAQNMRICGTSMAVLHDKEFKEHDVDVEVQIAVAGEYRDTEHVRFKHEKAQTVASTTFTGAYSQFSAVYAALATWVNESGYEFCGAMMDIYHVSPHETQNPDEFVTEICCPVRRK